MRLLVRTPLAAGVVVILLLGLDEFVLAALGLPYLLAMSVGFGLLIPLLVIAAVAKLTWIWTCFLMLAMLAMIMPGLPLGRAASRGYRFFYRDNPATIEAWKWVDRADWQDMPPEGKTYLQNQRDAPACMGSLRAHSVWLDPRTKTARFKVGGGEALLIVGDRAEQVACGTDHVCIEIQDNIWVACVHPRW